MVNLRPETFQQLREAAARNDRSISGEARYRLWSSFREDRRELPIDKAILLPEDSDD